MIYTIYGKKAFLAFLDERIELARFAGRVNYGLESYHPKLEVRYVEDTGTINMRLQYYVNTLQRVQRRLRQAPVMRARKPSRLALVKVRET